MFVTIAFWTLILIIVYCYLGYTLLLITFVAVKRIFNWRKTNDAPFNELPDISLVIAAYNEIDIVKAKIENTKNINYPQDKITQIWVTDGSNDGSPELIKTYQGVTVIHDNERKGKASAINHAMSFVETPITIFCDANTMLNSNAIIELVKPFANPKVGCVAGEKRILFDNKTGASSTGEGLYWKYESIIKKIESETGSTLSAVGELFAIRTSLFKPLRPDTILDDFEVSTQIALLGYKVKYAPNAIATESGSVNFDEEKKRKIRIAAGGFQTLFRSYKLLNPFINPLLTFKYISHKVLRWTIVPWALCLLPLINFILLIQNCTPLYLATFIILIFFYIVALLGYILKSKDIKLHMFFLPYYTIMMNISEIEGLIRYLTKKQTVNWEKAKRET